MSENYEKWMCDQAPFIQNKKLVNLCIPGTHDSGSYEIGIFSNDGQDLTQRVKTLLDNKFYGFVARWITKRWSVTQNLNFYNQMKQGIRYFDLRIQFDNNYSFVHGLVSASLDSLFIQLIEFLDEPEHDKEIIFLHFNHFYNMTQDQHYNLISILKTRLQERLVPNTLANLATVNEIWKTTHRVVLFYNNNILDTSILSSDLSIQAPWANSQNIESLKNYLNNELEYKKETFFVVQAIITPDENGDMIKKGLNPFNSSPSSIKQLARSTNVALAEWISLWNPLNINIIICDYFNDFDFVKRVTNLNKYIDDQ